MPPEQEISSQLQNLTAARPGDPKQELSATTIARMMGVATISDLQLVEGKVDLLLTKLSALAVKLDKAISIVNNGPTGSDLERIDVQIGSLKAMIRDALVGVGVAAEQVEKAAKSGLRPNVKNDVQTPRPGTDTADTGAAESASNPTSDTPEEPAAK